jgi:hypothetical protein
MHFQSFSDLMDQDSVEILNIFNLILNEEKDETYLYITLEDNVKLVHPAFLRVPKKLIRTLEIAHKSWPLDQLEVKILHPLNCNEIGLDSVFQTFEEVQEKYPKKVNKLDKLTDFFRIEKVFPLFTPEELINQRYPQGHATILSSSHTSRRVFWEEFEDDIFTISTVIISTHKLFIKANGELHKKIKYPNQEDTFFEKAVLDELMKSLYEDKKGNQNLSINERARALLKEIYPKIGDEALNRIVPLATPDRCRKHSWWLKS